MNRLKRLLDWAIFNALPAPFKASDLRDERMAQVTLYSTRERDVMGAPINPPVRSRRS